MHIFGIMHLIPSPFKRGRWSWEGGELEELLNPPDMDASSPRSSSWGQVSAQDTDQFFLSDSCAVDGTRQDSMIEQCIFLGF